MSRVRGGRFWLATRHGHPVHNRGVRVLLVSTYEMGRQPFGLASPAAWLRAAGHEVTQADVSVTPMPRHAVESAGLIAFFLPMHTATRLFLRLVDRIRAANPRAHLCAYGLYAPLNEPLLRDAGIGTILGGEFESGPRELAGRLSADTQMAAPAAVAKPRVISTDRQQFLVPDRQGLPPLGAYAQLVVQDGTRRVGYTEACAAASTIAATAPWSRSTAACSALCNARSCWRTCAGRSPPAPPTSPSATRISSTARGTPSPSWKRSMRSGPG